MAQIILENVHPHLLRKLEERAHRLGTTLQTEALRLLQENLADVEEAPQIQTEASPSPARPISAPAATAGPPAIPSPHPDEYVLFAGGAVVFHSPRQREALARYASALREAGAESLWMMPPKPRSRPDVPAVVRGRALARSQGRSR